MQNKTSRLLAVLLSLALLLGLLPAVSLSAGAAEDPLFDLLAQMFANAAEDDADLWHGLGKTASGEFRLFQPVKLDDNATTYDWLASVDAAGTTLTLSHPDSGILTIHKENDLVELTLPYADWDCTDLAATYELSSPDSSTILLQAKLEPPGLDDFEKFKEQFPRLLEIKFRYSPILGDGTPRYTLTSLEISSQIRGYTPEWWMSYYPAVILQTEYNYARDHFYCEETGLWLELDTLLHEGTCMSDLVFISEDGFHFPYFRYKLGFRPNLSADELLQIRAAGLKVKVPDGYKNLTAFYGEGTLPYRVSQWKDSSGQIQRIIVSGFDENLDTTLSPSNVMSPPKVNGTYVRTDREPPSGGGSSMPGEPLPDKPTQTVPTTTTEVSIAPVLVAGTAVAAVAAVGTVAALSTLPAVADALPAFLRPIMLPVPLANVALVSSSGAPLPDAKVVFASAKTGEVIAAFDGLQGTLSGRLPAGTYHVTVSCTINGQRTAATATTAIGRGQQPGRLILDPAASTLKIA